MPYDFQNGKAKHEPFEYDRLGLSGEAQNRYITSFASPFTINDSKTQICCHDDIIQLRLAITNAPKNGDIFYVADKFKPAAPVLFMVVRDSNPYTPVGTAFLGMDGTFSFYQSAAGSVQIFGVYKVKPHE